MFNSACYVIAPSAWGEEENKMCIKASVTVFQAGKDLLSNIAHQVRTLSSERARGRPARRTQKNDEAGRQARCGPTLTSSSEAGKGFRKNAGWR